MYIASQDSIFNQMKDTRHYVIQNEIDSFKIGRHISSTTTIFSFSRLRTYVKCWVPSPLLPNYRIALLYKVGVGLINLHLPYSNLNLWNKDFSWASSGVKSQSELDICGREICWYFWRLTTIYVPFNISFWHNWHTYYVSTYEKTLLPHWWWNKKNIKTLTLKSHEKIFSGYLEKFFHQLLKKTYNQSLIKSSKK